MSHFLLQSPPNVGPPYTLARLILGQVDEVWLHALDFGELYSRCLGRLHVSHNGLQPLPDLAVLRSTCLRCRCFFFCISLLYLRLAAALHFFLPPRVCILIVVDAQARWAREAPVGFRNRLPRAVARTCCFPQHTIPSKRSPRTVLVRVVFLILH